MLPNDVTRCLGRSDLTPESRFCELRHRCARYVQIEADLRAQPEGTAIYRRQMIGGACMDSGDHFMYLERGE